MGEVGAGGANRNRLGNPTDMEVDDASAKSTKFAFNVLQLIKTAQGEHGVRHHDYTRYRRYCTARLRRLYKSLKFTHGRMKYNKRQIMVETVTNVRFLHIILYLAERAWAYAMAIKQKGDGINACERYHLVGRLSKAVKWAELFSHACAEKADPRTSLEATAYALNMKACYLVEREKNWDVALKHFKNARAIYEELGKFGSVENQVLCRQRVDDELEPNIRYCLYKMGLSDMAGSEVLDLSTQEDPALNMLQAKLEVVMAEAKSRQAITMTELEWLGRKFPIHNAKIRACIVKAQQLEKGLVGSSMSSERKLRVYDKMLGAYQDAKRHIRDDLVTAGNAEDVKDELSGLDKAVSCILLQRTMDRNQLLVAVTRNKLSRHKPQRNTKEDKDNKSPKPLEVVCLFDILIQNLVDLSDLVTSGRLQSSEEASLAKELEVKHVSLQAQRCYFLAQSYSGSGKFTEAYMLYHRSREYADTASNAYKTLQQVDEVTIEELRKLSEECRVQSCLVHASGIADLANLQETVQKGVASISLVPQTSIKKVGYLLEKLDQYESFVALPGSKEPPRIVQLPPAFQAVPCKPIVLDTAVSAIEFPSLEAHLKKEDKKKSFFGFWRS